MDTNDKARAFHEKMEAMADAATCVFEDWLKKNSDANYEQKHSKLKEIMQSNSMMVLMMMSFSM